MPQEHKSILTLGPVLFLWDGSEWRDFYFQIADEAPVEVVFLGEVVCSKRRHFTEPYITDVVERLRTAGKQVVLSSLILATQPREIDLNRDLAGQDMFPVEANDLSLLPMLSGTPHAVGPFVNVYNSMTANFLARSGAQSICLPPELPLNSIQAIAQSHRGADIEVFAHGRAPLAISARCAHARAKGNSKDNCRFVCGEDPSGLPVHTLSKQPFLAINGVQTMSYACHSAIGEVPALLDCGVRRFRLSPQRTNMVNIAELYHGVLSGRIDGSEGYASLLRLCPEMPVANGFLHGHAGADFCAGQRMRESRETEFSG